MLLSCFLVPLVLVRQVLRRSIMKMRSKKEEQEIEKAIDILARDSDLLDEIRKSNTVTINGKKYRRVEVEPIQ